MKGDMFLVLAVCGSITYAMKAKEMLTRRGVSAYVVKAPTGLYSFGCNYSVKFSCQNPAAALELFRREGIKLGAFYKEEAGEWREIFRRGGSDDLS